MKKKINNKTSGASAKPVKSNVVLYRLLVILALDIIAVASLISIKKDAATESFFVFDVIPVMIIVFGALAAAAVIYWIVTKVKQINVSSHTCTPSMIFSCMAAGLLICLMYKQMSMQKIIIGIIILTGLYFIYYLYSSSFYIYSLYTAIAYVLLAVVGGVNYFSGMSAGVFTAMKITAIVFALAAVSFALAAKVKGGTINFGSVSVRVYEGKKDIIPVLVTTGLLIAGAAVSFFAAGFIMYISMALLVTFLVTAIVYTIKMI